MTTKQFIWKPFFIKELFNKFQTGKINNVSSFTVMEDNGIEYIGATNKNNGCLYFIEKKESNNFITKGNCIGFIKDGDGSAGYAIYKYENFFSTINVIYGYANWLDRDTGLYFVTCQDKIKNKYSHAYKRNIKHLNGDKVMLPSNGVTPNYGFMKDSAFNKQIELIKRYKSFAEKRLQGISIKNIPSLHDKKWKPFHIKDLFDEKQIIGGKSKGLTHLDTVKTDGVNYLGATNKNNGVLCYVDKQKTNNMLQKGNCICFIKNGDGSAGYAIYKAEPFVATSDILVAYSKWINKYTGLFFVIAQDKIKSKYSHGYKRNKKHLLADMIMLPVNSDDQPDYEYMEQYIKNLMIRKYNQYLDYIKSLPYGDRI